MKRKERRELVKFIRGLPDLSYLETIAEVNSARLDVMETLAFAEEIGYFTPEVCARTAKVMGAALDGRQAVIEELSAYEDNASA